MLYWTNSHSYCISKSVLIQTTNENHFACIARSFRSLIILQISLRFVSVCFWLSSTDFLYWISRASLYIEGILFRGYTVLPVWAFRKLWYWRKFYPCHLSLLPLFLFFSWASLFYVQAWIFGKQPPGHICVPGFTQWQ